MLRQYPLDSGGGEKTALKLLHRFGSVEGVLDHVDQLTGKLRERVKEHGRQARMSKDLATIYCDVPLGFSVEDTRYEGYDRGRVAALFERLEFKSLLERIGGKESVSGSSRKLRKVEVQTVEPEDRESWNDFLETPSSPSGWRWTGKIITGRRSSAWPFPTGRRTCMFPGGPPGTGKSPPPSGRRRKKKDRLRRQAAPGGPEAAGFLEAVDWPSTRFALPAGSLRIGTQPERPGPAGDGRIPSPGRRGVRERGEAPPSRGREWRSTWPARRRR